MNRGINSCRGIIKKYNKIWLTYIKGSVNILIIKGGFKMRKQFTTSIDTETSRDFKDSCERYGVKMNIVLEAFMKQFSDDEFSIKISKEGIRLEIEGK